MPDPEKLVGAVRRRLRLVHFAESFQRDLALAAGVAFAFAAVARVVGYQTPFFRLVLVVFGAAVGAALVAMLLRSVSRRSAASEADRILGTRERISTQVAVESGHADDPLGFLPAISADAASAARAAPRERIRSDLPIRPRRSLVVAAAFLVALLLVPLLPAPVTEARAEEDTPAEKQAKDENQEALRRLARKVKQREEEAKKAKQRELEKLTRQVQKEANRLAGQRPDAKKALARLNRLEREVKKEAKRFAGIQVEETEEMTSEEDKLLEKLSEAIAGLEGADAKETRRRFDRLWDKIDSGDLSGIDPAELQSTLKSLRDLQQALSKLDSMAGNANAERLKQLLASLPDSEKLGELIEALEKLRKAMEEKGLKASDLFDEESLKRLQQQMRDYRGLQMTEEDLERMLAALEQLRKMIELGEDIKLCAGGLGGLVPIPGLGGGAGLRFPGLPGAGGTGSGNGTGGAGQGRGGLPPVGENGRPIAPEKLDGQLSEEGAATLIRTVRRPPKKDEDPRAYEELEWAATREAEEALRRGEIPRRRQEYIRRYFSDPGDSGK